jgi:hypothetical protein
MGAGKVERNVEEGGTMRANATGWMGGIGGAVLSAFIAAAGCAGADDVGTSEQQAELHIRNGFHHPHHDGDAGTVGISGTGGGMGAAAAADCDVCTQAAQCCAAVEASDQGCSFNATTCASEVGPARPAYVNGCLTYVVSVRGAWGGNPPAACR